MAGARWQPTVWQVRGALDVEVNYSRFKALKVKQSGPRLTLTLANPPFNAMTPAIHSDLADIMPVIASDTSVRVVVLTGEGDVFCAGGDINKMIGDLEARDFSNWGASMNEARRILLGFLDLDKPIVARVNGHAMGLGATLALFADIAVMSTKARLADPHVQVGLTAGDGGALIWPLLAGYARAKRYLLTGDRLTAQQCLDFGMVAEVAAPDELDGVVDSLVAKLAGLSPLALSSTKRAINMPLLREAVASMDAHLGLETFCKIGGEHLEAARAIMEKRAPQF